METTKSNGSGFLVTGIILEVVGVIYFIIMWVIADLTIIMMGGVSSGTTKGAAAAHLEFFIASLIGMGLITVPVMIGMISGVVCIVKFIGRKNQGKNYVEH